MYLFSGMLDSLCLELFCPQDYIILTSPALVSRHLVVTVSRTVAEKFRNNENKSRGEIEKWSGHVFHQMTPHWSLGLRGQYSGRPDVLKVFVLFFGTVGAPILNQVSYSLKALRIFPLDGLPPACSFGTRRNFLFLCFFRFLRRGKLISVINMFRWLFVYVTTFAKFEPLVSPQCRRRAEGSFEMMKAIFPRT